MPKKEAMTAKMRDRTLSREERLLSAVAPLLVWYGENARELPWRQCPTPYRVWVSEIMLQQTRVEVVKPYFVRFTEELPSVEALAAADEDKLRKLWEGLGYYSRVRNMKKTAVLAMEQYGGHLPENFEALKKLPGIGPYTAGAIASIAFQIPVPAVDGNVLRVLTRLTADDSDIRQPDVKRRMEQQLLKIIPADSPGDFNQALMELGAIVCIPGGKPLCRECPFAALCLARENGLTENIPVCSSKKTRTLEEKTVFVIQSGPYTAVRQRNEKGLLADMYEFPCLDGFFSLSEAEELLEKCFGHRELWQIDPLPESRHVFTHKEWHMRAWRLIVPDEILKDSREIETLIGKLIFTDKNGLERTYAIPSAFKAYRKMICQNAPEKDQIKAG